MLGVNWLRRLAFGLWNLFRHDRALLGAIDFGQIRSLVEIGVGDGRRTEAMLRLALRHHSPSEVRYAGIDLFEGRPAAAPGVALKAFHRLVKSFGVQTLLSPGEPAAALARSANALTGADLIVIAADQAGASLERAWLYVPRMMHPGTLVFLEEAHGSRKSLRLLSRLEVERLAQASRAAGEEVERRAA